MKTLLSNYRIACLLLNALLFGASLHGQGAEPFQFTQVLKYGDDKSELGSFLYSIDYTKDGGVGEWIISNGSLTLDMKGARTGELRILVRKESVDFCKKCALVIRSDCRPDGTKQLKPRQGQEINLSRSTTTTRGQVRFDIVQNGSGQLIIGFDVVRIGETEYHCDQFITIPYTVKGLFDPAIPACEEALQAFKADRLAGTSRLERVLQKYSNAPCRIEIEDIVKQYNLYKKAKDTETTNCDEARKLCELYRKSYPENGKFNTDIDAIFNRCPEQKKVKDIKIEKTQPPEIPADVKAWSTVQRSKNPNDFIAFLANYPKSKYASEAQKVLGGLKPIEVQENRINDLQRSYKLINVNQPRYKDMSLGYGLKVEADELATANTFSVNLKKPGEYAIRIVDDTGKDTIIRINSSFSGELSALPDGTGYFVKISGGRKPYSIVLEDLETNKPSVLRGTVNTDTLIITLADLDQRSLTGQYRLKVKSFASRDVIELGKIDNSVQSFDPTNIILMLLGLLVITCVLYLFYTLLRNRKTRRKKQYTIYDQANY